MSSDQRRIDGMSIDDSDKPASGDAVRSFIFEFPDISITPVDV